MDAHRARRRWVAGLAIAGVVVAGALFALPATAQVAPAPLSPSLTQALSGTSSAAAVPVLVHGATLADAQRAVDAPGMQRITTYRKIGVVAARASRDQVDA